MLSRRTWCSTLLFDRRWYGFQLGGRYSAWRGSFYHWHGGRCCHFDCRLGWNTTWYRWRKACLLLPVIRNIYWLDGGKRRACGRNHNANIIDRQRVLWLVQPLLEHVCILVAAWPVRSQARNNIAYVFALLFVMFDVEAVFIFPWATRLEAYGTFGLIEMGIFVFILLLGLVYAWRKGVLKWV